MTPLMHPSLIAQAAGSNGPMATIMTFLPFVVLGLFFWFLIIRPQKKEAQRLEVFRSKLKVGDEIITNSGIYGKITSIDDISVYLEVARSTKIKILKQEVRMFSRDLQVSVSEQSPEVEAEKKSA